MSKAFWIRRYLMVATLVFGVLMAVALLKGRTLAVGAEDSLLWAAISAAIYVATRYHYAKKGIACAMCRDIPEE